GGLGDSVVDLGMGAIGPPLVVIAPRSHQNAGSGVPCWVAWFRVDSVWSGALTAVGAVGAFVLQGRPRAHQRRHGRSHSLNPPIPHIWSKSAYALSPHMV